MTILLRAAALTGEAPTMPASSCAPQLEKVSVELTVHADIV